MAQHIRCHVLVINLLVACLIFFYLALFLLVKLHLLIEVSAILFLTHTLLLAILFASLIVWVSPIWRV